MGGNGSLRLSYGRPKLTLISRFVATQLRGNEKLTLCYFWSDCFDTNRTWTPIYRESMFYSFQSDRTKTKKVLVFFDTAIASRQILKWGSTSAGRNSTLKTPYPPLPYIFWTVWTGGVTRYQLKYTIPIKKNEKIAIEWSVFWAIFGDFWGLI